MEGSELAWSGRKRLNDSEKFKYCQVIDCWLQQIAKENEMTMNP